MLIFDIELNYPDFRTFLDTFLAINSVVCYVTFQKTTPMDKHTGQLRPKGLIFNSFEQTIQKSFNIQNMASNYAPLFYNKIKFFN